MDWHLLVVMIADPVSLESFIMVSMIRALVLALLVMMTRTDFTGGFHFGLNVGLSNK